MTDTIPQAPKTSSALSVIKGVTFFLGATGLSAGLVLSPAALWVANFKNKVAVSEYDNFQQVKNEILSKTVQNDSISLTPHQAHELKSAIHLPEKAMHKTVEKTSENFINSFGYCDTRTTVDTTAFKVNKEVFTSYLQHPPKEPTFYQRTATKITDGLVKTIYTR